VKRFQNITIVKHAVHHGVHVKKQNTRNPFLSTKLPLKFASFCTRSACQAANAAAPAGSSFYSYPTVTAALRLSEYFLTVGALPFCRPFNGAEGHAIAAATLLPICKAAVAQ
jgi:hypothetical protein